MNWAFSSLKSYGTIAGDTIAMSDDVAVEADEKLLDYVVLDEALCRMEKQDERMSQIVMLRFFAGLTIEDTAQALGISPMTVKREWACARAWLYDELYRDEE